MRVRLSADEKFPVLGVEEARTAGDQPEPRVRPRMIAHPGDETVDVPDRLLQDLRDARTLEGDATRAILTWVWGNAPGAFPAGFEAPEEEA